jgi:tetratricopeptide (TPR) repeat protein
VRILKIILLTNFFLFVAAVVAAPDSEEEFRLNLNKLYYNTNESINILRKQISENQLAPFLPNLFLELGTLLNKKSSILYYINKEKGIAITEKSKELSEIEAVAKESIEIFQKILSEFPRFDKKAQVVFSLAVTHKSLGNITEFYKYADILKRDYSKEKNTYKIQILLGIELLKKGLIDEALSTLKIVSSGPFKFEASQARIKIAEGLALQRRLPEALELYKQVIVDNLDVEINKDESLERKLENITLSDDVKNDALQGSVKIYPLVFDKDPRPIEYYSSFVPTEKLFQDTIEKLAFRYVSLSKFDTAIVLFRKLSERIASPEKVINIYRDVLSRIPIEQRAYFPLEEVQYVMLKFNEWRSYFNPPREVYLSAYNFFEKHLRDIATRRHDAAKKSYALIQSKKEDKIFSEKQIVITNENLLAAQELYLLYESFFPDSKIIPKMKYNLADTYFRSKNFTKCADTYIELYQKIKKTDFLEKAVYCLSQDFVADFYHSKRSKGLMIYALTELIKNDPKRAKDIKTKFLLLKAKFDQGLVEEAIPAFEKFIHSNPRSSFASDSTDIIIDYLNTKGDYGALSAWAKKMQKVKFSTVGYNAKLLEVEKQAKLKLLNSKIQSMALGKGNVVSGAIYLQSALNIEDKELQSLALKSAIVKSKSEEDMSTFFKTAKILAEKSNDNAEKVEIFSLMARENMRIGQYIEGQKIYESLLGENNSSNSNNLIFEELFSYSLLMRDFNKLSELVSSSYFKSLKKDLVQNFKSLVIQAFSSPVKLNTSSIERLIAAIEPDLDFGLALYKLSGRYSGKKINSILAELIKNRCQKGSIHVFCGWVEFERTVDDISNFIQKLNSSQGDIDSLEKYAAEFENLINKQGRFKGSDPAYDILIAMSESLLYKSFGVFIAKIANSSEELKALLAPRASQLIVTSKQIQSVCQQIVDSSNTVAPFSNFCSSPKVWKRNFWWNWKQLKDISYEGHPSSSFSMNLKKKHFSEKDQESSFKLSYSFLQKNYPHIANFVLQQEAQEKGNSVSKNTVKGCSLMNMGYVSEAYFLLSKINSNLAKKCLALSR